MLPTNKPPAEPLPTYLKRHSKRLLFNPAKKQQAEHARSLRAEANLRQPFFHLPAELRQQIYDHLIPSAREIRRARHPRTLKRVPNLMHTCQRLRAETSPLFYARNTVVVTLQHLTQHPRSPLRLHSSIALLPDSGSQQWRRMRLESCSRCFHSDGYAVLANIDVFIDRNEGSVVCRPRGLELLWPCCQAAQRDFSRRLLADVKNQGFGESERRLARRDFERLASRMDESKADWPKGAKRVVPQRFGSVC